MNQAMDGFPNQPKGCIDCGAFRHKKYNRCYPCLQEAQKVWRHPERPCPRCNVNKRMGGTTYCYPCANILSAESAERNKHKPCTRCDGIPRKLGSSWCYECHYRHIIMRQYGLTSQDYDRMEREQNGLCAICGKPNVSRKRLAVDHDHETNTVRALLCDLCNNGLGAFRESPERMANAIAYVKEWGQKRETLA